MPDAGGLRAEATTKQSFADHDFPRMGGIDASVMNTPVVNDTQAAAYHALHRVNRTLFLVPPRSGVMGFTEMGSYLLHPLRFQPGGAAHP